MCLVKKGSDVESTLLAFFKTYPVYCVLETCSLQGAYAHGGGHPKTGQAGGLPWNVCCNAPDLLIGRRVINECILYIALFSQKVCLQQAILHRCCAGGTNNPTTQPGTDTTLPGVTGPTPVAAAPAASLGLAGGTTGTSAVPQSLLQFGTLLHMGNLRDDSPEKPLRCQALQFLAAKLLLSNT